MGNGDWGCYDFNSRSNSTPQPAILHNVNQPSSPRRTRLRRPLILLAIALGLPTAGASVAAWFGRLGWPFELATHFRPQYAAALATSAALFLLTRYWRLSVLAFVLAGIDATCLLPYYRTSLATHSSTATDSTVTLCHINVKRDNRDWPKVAEYIRKVDPDVLLICEVDAFWAARLEDIAGGYPVRAVDARSDNFGIAMFVRDPEARVEIVHLTHPERIPSVRARMRLGSETLVLYGVHPLPPVRASTFRMRDADLQAIASAALETDGAFIAFGDFNVTPWSPSFRVLDQAGLRNAARGRGYATTWRTGSALAIPIDHVLHNAHVEVLRHFVGDDVGSDHRPVTATIRLRQVAE